MRYVVQHHRPGGVWQEKAATNDEHFAKSLLQTFALAGAQYGPTGTFRLIDVEPADLSGEPEILATIGVQP